MIIKYKLITDGCDPVINSNGDAFDLVAAKDINIAAPTIQTDSNKVVFKSTIVPLGIAMELPKGFVADLKPRSSMYKKWRILQTNSVGLIDSSYCGDGDEWGLSVVALGTSHIKMGDRICQFEIRPSQNATVWQKLKWLFSAGVYFEKVDSLDNNDRGGFGEGTKNI